STLTATTLIGVVFLLCYNRAVVVQQPYCTVIISQGDPVLFNCTYQISGAPVPFWYVQSPSAVLRLFVWDIGSMDSHEGIMKGFNATHNKKSQSFHLWKQSRDLSDSATYYCDGRGTVAGTSRGPEEKPPTVCAEQQEMWSGRDFREKVGGGSAITDLRTHVSNFLGFHSFFQFGTPKLGVSLTIFEKLFSMTVIKDSINNNTYNRPHDFVMLMKWHWLNHFHAKLPLRLPIDVIIFLTNLYHH
uniref:Immunoglobulin V-set domain-containing protein n=1 Tax=Pelusios castaneus TaxID=367368 RepID=A0A8C8SIT6_9SAUR